MFSRFYSIDSGNSLRLKMWLTRVLLAHKFYPKKSTPGKQWIGKHRRYRHVTNSMLANMQKRLAIEQENARHLSTPYLSKEESFRHMWPLKAAKTDAFMKEKYFAKVKPHKTMDEHLAFLKTTRTW